MISSGQVNSYTRCLLDLSSFKNLTSVSQKKSEISIKFAVKVLYLGRRCYIQFEGMATPVPNVLINLVSCPPVADRFIVGTSTLPCAVVGIVTDYCCLSHCLYSSVPYHNRTRRPVLSVCHTTRWFLCY
jgi:hypothetical protein